MRVKIREERKKKKFTAATSGRHSDHFYRIRLEKVDLPPRARLALSLCAPLPIMLRARISVVSVAGVSASHGGRLVRRFAKSDVCPCNNASFHQTREKSN